ncbi:MAG: molybdopterin molybdotransferase MoeA [Sphingomonadales bacterium]|nr:molybdopterin molybdotransferase MoeA [Sphingomonadales bacterium]MDE2570028.1 molybdopterin molybdotransferase MoeA [Sphingomonadales bacterium]
MKQAPLPLVEAQARLLDLAPALRLEHRAAEECAGFYLAEPLLAKRDQPARPVSAMDGYACRAADLPGPCRVIGESAAGHPWQRALGAGEAVRISTGAVVPEGADAVVLQEDCAREGEQVRVTGEPPSPPHRHIRPAAMDFARTHGILPAGTRLGPTQIALAIAGGHHLLPVRAKPRVAVIDSGDELVAPGCECAPHQLPASNGPMLAAMVSAYPSEVTRIGPVPDSIEAIIAALDTQPAADIVVTSGGASVGEHDLIRPALAEIGAELTFWRVAIKPGKPLLVARRGEQLILGLPGNPASAFVTGWLFLLPLLRKALGSAEPLPRSLPVPLGAPMAKGGGRMEFIRARWDGTSVVPEALQDSGALSPLAHANALIVREAGAPPREAGTDVPVMPLALLDY